VVVFAYQLLLDLESGGGLELDLTVGGTRSGRLEWLSLDLRPGGLGGGLRLGFGAASGGGGGGAGSTARGAAALRLLDLGRRVFLGRRFCSSSSDGLELGFRLDLALLGRESIALRFPEFGAGRGVVGVGTFFLSW
jgi:hypothetical protein